MKPRLGGRVPTSSGLALQACVTVPASKCWGLNSGPQTSTGAITLPTEPSPCVPFYLFNGITPSKIFPVCCFLQGIWSPQKIPNPDYFEDDHPFLLTSFSALGLELWSMTPNIYFDNFIICSEKEVADRWAADGWGLKIIVANANEV